MIETNKIQKTNESNIEEMIAELMQKEYRKDAEFRFAILATELGDIGKYITHDQILNPSARVHGSFEDEKMAYGQVIVQLMALAHIRGINYKEALNRGLDNWLESDWKKRDSVTQKDKRMIVTGLSASPGLVYGEAYIINSAKDVYAFKELKVERILIMDTARPDFVNAMPYVSAIVTNHGGYTCHAASICREHGIPCIVGTGDVTEKISHGAKIVVYSGTQEKPRQGFVALQEESK